MEKEACFRNKMKQNIMLIGFMGTGKSTIAKELSKTLGMDHVEMDQMITKRENMEISNIFDKFGQEYFRDLESNLLTEIQMKTGQIVSCGGGVALRPKNIERMKSKAIVVLLTASPEVIFERVQNETSRPILNDHMNVEYIRELNEKRKGSYLAAADIMIETDGKSIIEISKEIIEKVSIKEQDTGRGIADV